MEKIKRWGIVLIAALHALILGVLYFRSRQTQKENVELKKKGVASDLKEIAQGNKTVPLSDLIKRNNARFRGR